MSESPSNYLSDLWRTLSKGENAPDTLGSQDEPLNTLSLGAVVLGKENDKENRNAPGRSPQNDFVRPSNNVQLVGLTIGAEDIDSRETVASSTSCETRVSMILCGEVITYDLQSSESDPRVVIELLKATKSERANYMIVAAYYRRTGDPQGAKDVLLSMIEGEYSS